MLGSASKINLGIRLENSLNYHHICTYICDNIQNNLLY